MKRTLLVSAAFIVAASTAIAGNYRSFKVSVYARAYEVEKMADSHWLDSTWNVISSQVKVDKVWLETHRDLRIVPERTLKAAIKFFKDKGLEAGGGITYTIDESNDFETFSYSDTADRRKVREIAEYTARFFDEVILDDFFFTSSKKDVEIDAKGDRTWSGYRLDLLAEAGRSLVCEAAKGVNPDVKVIIKYPNWYDHFQGLGFDLSRGPDIFDGVWTGTETRDPSGAQHLQNYLSYNVVTYYDNLRPGHNFGGWVDSGGSGMGMDRYAEQLWLTLFAKAPEITLFDYRQLLGVGLDPAIHRTPWQGQGTSFDYDSMEAPATTIARVAGTAIEGIDPFVWQLGKPVGIKSFKAFNTSGDDFLQNYLGMIGLPMDMVPEFPEGEDVVLLTAQAAGDPDLLEHIKAQLRRGGDVVITTGLIEAAQPVVDQICQLRLGGDVLVSDMGRHGEMSRDILIPKIGYFTNDAWEVISAGRPLRGGVSGFPVLLRARYSNGDLYVLAVPPDFGNLYDYPAPALDKLRAVMCRGLKVRLEGPAKVALLLYDNDTFIIESFLDEPANVAAVIPAGAVLEELSGIRATFHSGGDGKVPMTIPPHSYRAFKIK